MNSCPTNARSRLGFTLFEVMLAMAILATLVGSIFSISASSLSFSESVFQAQEKNRHHVAFSHYLDNIFLNLPAEAKIVVGNNDEGFPVLTIHDPSSYYPFAGKDEYAARLQATLTKDRNGNFSLFAFFQNFDERDNDKPAAQSMRLIGNIASLEWSLFSPLDQKWHPDWEKTQKRPNHIKLVYQLVDEAKKRELLFWIPPRASTL